jgi:hypothetical protein
MERSGERKRRGVGVVSISAATNGESNSDD